MADKAIRIPLETWKAARVAAAEADVTLRTFVDRAVKAAVQSHESRKADEVRVQPVEFVGRS